MNKYERHLSAAAMVAGFIVDQIFFGRVDLARTQALFIAYIVICVVSIALLHRIETRTSQGYERPRWRPVVPFVTQFTLGGFWSGFVFFYGRAAVLGVSWPYLALLVAILLGNEIFKKYHERLIFTNVLFFFALFSYAIFAVPVYTGSIGVWNFLFSGIVAAVLFVLFQFLLYALGKSRYKSAMRPITTGAVIVYLLINFFYFTGILPPLPLSLKTGGIYESVVHTGTTYTALREHESFLVDLGLKDPTLHIPLGSSLYAYGAVFAPIALTTTITHRWQWYDPKAGEWVTEAAVAYPIEGGRDGGYLGYSAKSIAMAGKWRVDIETIDGRLIGRLGFSVVAASSTPAESTSILN